MDINKIFKLQENGTNVRTELIAGLTTFMTMAYILALNPSVLGAAGMDTGAVFTATALIALISTLLMAFTSNYPFVLAPGVGLTVYFSYTVVLQMGYSWQVALAAVFVEGIIFIILTLTSIREALFNAIPMNLKYAVSAGIGMFIAFIGLQNANIVVDGATLVSIFSFKNSVADGTFNSVGIGAILALVGVLITGILLIKQVKGAILWGIVSTWVIGIICQLTGIYQVNIDLQMYSLLPDFSRGLSIPSLAPTFMQMDFTKMISFDFLVVVFAFLFVDLFDTLGTITGVSSRANMLDSNGKLPKIRQALLSDAVGTSLGAVLGTSTCTTYVESASGVAEGGRTGLTAVVAALLFGLSLFLSPFFLAIPAFATAPALVIVGFLMMSSALKIDFNDYTEALPGYLCMIAMPFTFSISEGIAIGIISYVVINLVTGNAKSKKISALMYVLAAIFILKNIYM